MKFEELRKQAVLEWEASQRNSEPRILVGKATCGITAGALDIIEAINAKLAEHKIKAAITQVGYIGCCYTEPIIDIIKPNRPRIRYGGVTSEIAAQQIGIYIPTL